MIYDAFACYAIEYVQIGIGYLMCTEQHWLLDEKKVKMIINALNEIELLNANK